MNFKAMVEQDIYPQIWDRDPAADHLVEFVVGGYEEVRRRFAQAADAGQGFIISLV